ncbi:protein TIFY 6B-like isoform X4 [Vigna umbellata]|uniref:protein TIFY 6B-like isoform X4 n=1 Tax=Vigna umbellata TaxID=87088 RepID=UPI001F5E9F31|nr:protein TIFY 6B-like isoform X4 [Vigna umbellata]
MERDFMGLNSKEPPTKVKEEINVDGYEGSGFTKGSIAQWPFSNKVSAIPHLMSFKASQDDKTKKMLSGPITAGLLSILSQDAIESSHKRSAGDTQKSFNHDGQGGHHFSLTQHDVNSVHRPHDVKMFSVPNQAISVSMGNPFLNNHFATGGQNMNRTSVKQSFLGGIPVSVPHLVIPNAGAVAGMVEPCMKPSPPSAQLTIFYGGTVKVFDDISAEKAQAIMLLAGSSVSVAHSMVQPKVHVPVSKMAAGDSVPATQPANTPPGSGLSSPISVSSHTGTQSGSGSTSTDEFLAAKTTGVPTTLVSNVDPPKVVSAATMLTSAVPQARKASLARFLEKRKERVTSAAPYNLNRKSEECGPAEFGGAMFSAGAATSTVSAMQG